MKKYIPIPVIALADIAESFEKDIVVISAWDREHSRLHVSTYGITEEDKYAAAKAGEIVFEALGGDNKEKIVFEDFRVKSET